MVIRTDFWADHVFNDDYRLIPINQLENEINANGRLPGMPSAEEAIQNGVDVGDMQVKLLEKVEELTLYMIELKKENETLKKEIQNLSDIINK